MLLTDLQANVLTKYYKSQDNIDNEYLIMTGEMYEMNPNDENLKIIMILENLYNDIAFPILKRYDYNTLSDIPDDQIIDMYRMYPILKNYVFDYCSKTLNVEINKYRKFIIQHGLKILDDNELNWMLQNI